MSSWLAWWPLLLAVVATPFAIKAAEILPLTGLPGLVRLRLLYPFPMLAQQFGGGSEDLRASLSQALMYVQFPVYALLLMATRRVRSLGAGLGVVLALHVLAVAALWLLPAI